MSVYVNVGAFIDGQRPPSKKALREALRDAPETVLFDCTEVFGEYAGRRFRAVEILPEQKLQVTIPDPYLSRRAFGTVTRNSQGVYKFT